MSAAQAAAAHWRLDAIAWDEQQMRAAQPLAPCATDGGPLESRHALLPALLPRAAAPPTAAERGGAAVHSHSPSETCAGAGEGSRGADEGAATTSAPGGRSALWRAAAARATARASRSRRCERPPPAQRRRDSAAQLRATRAEPAARCRRFALDAPPTAHPPQRLRAALRAAAAACRAAPDAAVAVPWADIRLKLHDVAPAELPATLRDAAQVLLGPTAVSLHAAVRPGCTLLTLDAVLLRPADVAAASGGGGTAAADAPPPSAPADVARALLAGPARAFFAAQRRFAVAPPAGSDAAAAEVRFGSVADASPAASPRMPSLVVPALPATLPAAVHSGACTAVAVLLPVGTTELYRLRCRVHGQYVGVSLARAPGGHPACHVITFPACAAAGLALLELEPLSGGWDDDSTNQANSANSANGANCATAYTRPAPTPVLLTPDADLAAEVGALRPPGSAAEEQSRAKLLACLGHSLRHGADAPQPLLRAAVRAALARGWVATAAALLPAWRFDANDGGEAGTAAAGAPTLLHTAVCARAPLAALATLRRWLPPAALAAEGAAAWAARVTPLHLAAALPDADVAAAVAGALLAAWPGDADVAWAAARDAAGRTPGDVAAATHRRAAAPLLRSLDASTRAAVAAAARRAAAAVGDATSALASPRGSAITAAICTAFRGEAAARAAALAAARDALELARDPMAAAVLTRALAALPATSSSSSPSLRRRFSSLSAPPLLTWRMPGSFADAAQEARWLAQTRVLFRFADHVGYPFAALSHTAQMTSAWLRSSSGRSHVAAPAAPSLVFSTAGVCHVAVMLLLVPTLLYRTPAFFGRHREAIHVSMRLLGSLMLPVWMRGGASGAAAPPVSPAQRLLMLFGMVLFSLGAIVRAPLHFATQCVSFAITVGLYGITAHLPLRLGVAALNLANVVAMERASRRRFAAAEAAAAKKAE